MDKTLTDILTKLAGETLYENRKPAPHVLMTPVIERAGLALQELVKECIPDKPIIKARQTGTRSLIALGRYQAIEDITKALRDRGLL